MCLTRKGGESGYNAVAVVKKGNFSTYNSLSDLAGKTACFPSVASMGGWVLPIARVYIACSNWNCLMILLITTLFYNTGCPKRKDTHL